MTLRYAAAAEQDLENLLEQGAEQFGADAAARYGEALVTRCRRLAEDPLHGRARNEVQAGLRSFPYRSHMIFYILLPAGGIEIARILHQRQDVTEAFDDPA